MNQVKYIAYLVVEIVGLFVLLQTLTHGGMMLLLGAGFGQVSKIVVEFGVLIMALTASGLSFFLGKERRHRVLRDVQIHIAKYLSILGLFQLLGYLLSNITESLTVTGAANIHPVFMSVMVMLYCMSAFMTPFNYVKSSFTDIKSVEFRNPSSIAKQYFK